MNSLIQNNETLTIYQQIFKEIRNILLSKKSRMDNIQIKQEEREDSVKFWMFGRSETRFIQYEWLPNGNFKANGTLVYDDFRDKKLGKPLFDALMNFAREKNVKIYPTCPFVVLSMKRDASTHDLWAEDYKAENGL